MLHQKILKEETFQLLKELMNDDYLQGFNLVGDTALAKRALPSMPSSRMLWPEPWTWHFEDGRTIR